ncbi:MAG: flavodoxin family protein [Oscillospiraceae bacterium]
MKVLMINGTMRKGSTYHIGKMLIDDLGAQASELFLPEDMPNFCTGCATCFMKGEEHCPHREYTARIEQLMDEADLIILTTPVYVFHSSGQMKALLDHFGYRWMVHRPSGTMFTKQAIAISTAAGGGNRSALKDITHSFFYWGVGKIYTYGKSVRALGWDEVSDKNKQKIARSVAKLARKIVRRNGDIVPSFKVRALFHIMRGVYKKTGMNPLDEAYWKNSGWLKKARPWKTNA